MGRLFWKFFLFVWLAQLLGMIAVACVFWLTAPRVDRPVRDLDAGPGGRLWVGAGAAVLRYGGAGAFRSWSARGGPVPVFAVDAAGSELLGRTVEPRLIDEARRLRETDPGSPGIASVTDPERKAWLLFAESGEEPRPPLAPGQRSQDTAPAPPFELAPGGPPHRFGPRGMRDWPRMGPLITTLIGSLLTAGLLAWYVAKPIRSLHQAFEAAADGDLRHRAAPLIGARKDELADLGREFDRMAGRLQDSMSRQRNLLYDVSHEVRSPLARLNAALGLLRQQGATDGAALDRIEEEIGRIDRLVGDLLKLSRLEAGELAEELEDIDLGELIAQVVADANFEARSTGQCVSWSGEARAALRGRPATLQVAFDNIVRNALKHASMSPLVTIETALDATRSRYLVRILDSGPGVPGEELEAIFTPFMRSGRAARTDGYGLGLAIARRSIEAHGGTIRAFNRREGGFAVEVSLPVDERDRPAAGAG